MVIDLAGTTFKFIISERTIVPQIASIIMELAKRLFAIFKYPQKSQIPILMVSCTVNRMNLVIHKGSTIPKLPILIGKTANAIFLPLFHLPLVFHISITVENLRMGVMVFVVVKVTLITQLPVVVPELAVALLDACWLAENGLPFMKFPLNFYLLLG